MRRFGLLIGATVFLGVVWWLRGNTDVLTFVVPTNREVLYATTFTDGVFLADWSTEDRRGYVSELVDEQLQLTIEEAVFLAPGTPNALRATMQYPLRDFDYRVEATALEGPLNNSFGVVFRQLDPQTYYIFYISSDGYYSVWRETPAGRIALSNWIPTDAVNQGTDGVTNRVRVVAQGSEFVFFVNDTPLPLCVPDAPSGESTYIEATATCVDGTMQPTLTDNTIPYGKIGVIVTPFVSGQLSVAFDNPVVLRPIE